MNIFDELLQRDVEIGLKLVCNDKKNIDDFQKGLEVLGGEYRLTIRAIIQKDDLILAREKMEKDRERLKEKIMNMFGEVAVIEEKLDQIVDSAIEIGQYTLKDFKLYIQKDGAIVMTGG